MSLRMSPASAAEREKGTAKGALSAPYLKFSRDDIVALFDPGELTTMTRGGERISLLYRLFVPNMDARGGTTYPLIVWIHGFGDTERFNVNTGQLKHLEHVFREPNQRDKYPFFLLAPQNRESGQWFGKSAADDSLAVTDEYGEWVIQLIDRIVDSYPIDRDRITLVGISSGGTAAWEFALRRPNMFAAVSPLASEGSSSPHLKRIVSVPIWAFHSEGDSPDGDRKTINRLQSLGGCCRLTEPLGRNHDCWTAAFTRFELLKWLLGQRKGNVCCFPSEPPWNQRLMSLLAKYWPQASIASAFAVVCVVLASRHRSVRRHVTPRRREAVDDNFLAR